MSTDYVPGVVYKTNYIRKMSLFRVDSPNQFTALEMERETVFSPNPMWYRPIWSCDFQCNLHGLQSSQMGRVAIARILLSAAYMSVSRWT